MKSMPFTTLTKHSVGALFLIFISIVIPFACMEYDDYSPVRATDPVLTASTSTVVLNQRSPGSDALSLSWSAASNRGTNAAIRYILEVDQEGNDFTAPVEIDLGKAVYNKKFSNESLNTLVSTTGLPLEEDASLEIRLKSLVADESVPMNISNVVRVVVTPYRPVSKTLFIIGDASPNGWNANDALPMVADADDPTTFVYEGALNAGGLKFITTQGQFLPSYNRGATGESLYFRTEDDQPDDKFAIAEAGVYRITLNLVELSITILKLSDPVTPPYDRLWIVGDATPNGWNIDNPNEMVQDAGDPFIFSYYEYLNAGEFKIPTATGNWSTDFYMPLVNEQDLSLTDVQLFEGGSPDNKWRITTPGPYKIILNLRDVTISIKPFTPYTQLWMVGDATPVGWNIDNPEPMVADAGDPNVFTYSGELKAGEFKIPVETGDFGGDYFMPVISHPEITPNVTMPMKFTPNGNPDNKWLITVPGNYKVTVNQLYETILFEPL